MDILLIRHGESYQSSLENYNPEKSCPDPMLTNKGRRQASSLHRGSQEKELKGSKPNI